MDHSYDVINPKEEVVEETVEESIVEEKIEEDKVLLEDEVDELVNESKTNPPRAHFYSKLIDLVRSYPNIYDKFDVNFKSTYAREKAWTDIADALKITVEFAQNRWIRLRERFAREKKALEVMHKTGYVNERKRLWPYFLPMLFLSSHIKPRKTNSLVFDNSTSSDSPRGDISVSKFLSVMGDKLNEEFNSPSTSSVKKDIEIIDDNHPDYLAWKKRKSDNTFTQIQPPRKILAKPDNSTATLMFTTKGKDGEKILTKLPPGAVLLKNPPVSMGTSPVVLVPTTPSGMNLNKAGSLPMIISQATQQVTSLNQNCESSPTPNSAEHHFGMLIARELERFPKEVRAKKKQIILMVLYE